MPSIWNRASQVWVLIEVALVFALCHLTYRSLIRSQIFLWEGVDYSPGLVMLLIPVLFCYLRRETFSEFGLTIDDWRFGVTVGTFGIALMIGLGLGLRLLGYREKNWAGVLALGLMTGISICFVLTILKPASEKGGVWRSNTATYLGLALLVGLVSLPFVVAANKSVPMTKMMAYSVTAMLGGVGEEVLFRGYIQSRINQEFRRPYHWLETQFGIGLFITSCWFGIIHVLNGVNYFAGTYKPAWTWGAITFFLGLFYGILRERTNSVLAPALVHATTGVVTALLTVIAASS